MCIDLNKTPGVQGLFSQNTEVDILFLSATPSLKMRHCQTILVKLWTLISCVLGVGKGEVSYHSIMPNFTLSIPLSDQFLKK